MMLIVKYYNRFNAFDAGDSYRSVFMRHRHFELAVHSATWEATYRWLCSYCPFSWETDQFDQFNKLDRRIRLGGRVDIYYDKLTVRSLRSDGIAPPRGYY